MDFDNNTKYIINHIQNISKGKDIANMLENLSALAPPCNTNLTWGLLTYMGAGGNWKSDEK